MDGVMLGVYGPFRPRSGAATRSATTDVKGRFHYRLPPGETYFYVMGQGSTFITLPNNGSSQTVNIPEGTFFEVPPIKVEAAVVVHGRIVDSKGESVPLVDIVGVFQNGQVLKGPGLTLTPAGHSDVKGEFRLAGQNHSAVPNRPATVVIRLIDNREIEISVTPGNDGDVIVTLPDKH